MTKAAKITILCEDLQHECFVRRFLMKAGLTKTRYDVRVEKTPAGSGAQWVRERFPKELRAYRSDCNRLRNGLIAVVDADKRKVADRIGELHRACVKEGVARKGKDERVLFVVPRRNIETWFAFLRGESVDEETVYPKYEYESLCQPDVEALDRMCRAGQLDGDPPASLQHCCVEFQAFSRLIK